MSRRDGLRFFVSTLIIPYLAVLYVIARSVDSWLKRNYPFVVMLSVILMLSGIVNTNYDFGNVSLMVAVGLTYLLMVFGLHTMYRAKDATNRRFQLLGLLVGFDCLLIGWVILEVLPWS